VVSAVAGRNISGDAISPSAHTAANRTAETESWSSGRSCSKPRGGSSIPIVVARL
jgi:hypothetical protein